MNRDFLVDEMLILDEFLSYWKNVLFRRSRLQVFLGKEVLKICSNFTGEYLCRSVISINCITTLSKSHFDMGALLQICCIFLEHLFARTPVDGCFWLFKNIKGTLMQIWKSTSIIVFTLKQYAEGFPLLQCLVFET